MSEPLDLPRVPPEMLAALDDPRLADMQDALPNFPRTRRLLEPSDPPKRGESRYLQFHDETNEAFGSLSWPNEPKNSFRSRASDGPRFAERPTINERKRKPKSRVDVFVYRGWLVASPAFVEVLRRFDADTLETIDIDWTFLDGQSLDGYVFLDVRRSINAYDYARSKLVVEMEKGRKFVAWLAHPRALRIDIDPSIHLFRDGYWDSHLYVSRSVAQALGEAGLRGFRFEDPANGHTVEFAKPKRRRQAATRGAESCAADNQWLIDLAATFRPSSRVQGTLVDSIFVAEDAFDDPDPYALLQAIIGYTNSLMLDARLVPGEFPQQALWAYYVDYYRDQVANRGHAQFLENSNFTPLTVGCCLRGLRALGATEHLATFEALVAFVRGSTERTLQAELAREVAPARSTLAALDERFADSPDLVAACDEWLRALECVRTASHEELHRISKEAAQANPLRERRLADEEQAGRDSSSAAERVVKALCKSAGIRYVALAPSDYLSMRKLAAAAPDRREFCWGVLTGKGVHQVFFYEARGLFRTRLRAELWRKDAPYAAAGMTLPRDEYQKIVPHYLLRGRTGRF